MAGQCNATLDCSFDYDNLGCDGNTLFFCFNIQNAVYIFQLNYMTIW